MNKRLEGRIAMITGAASGIGEAAAALFAQEGARLVLVDRAERVVEVAAAIGENAIGICGDVATDSVISNAVDTAVARFGGLDIVFANAGVSAGPAGLFDETSSQWAELLRINLIGPFLAIKYAAPVLAGRGGGSIICTASVAALRSGAGAASYSASKAGVVSLVQSASQQLVGSGVRVNAICPGLIETGMTRARFFEPARAAGKEYKLGQLNPLKRAGQAGEIATTALFLASSDSSYINGQALVVDGGLSSSHPVTRQEYGKLAR